MARLQHFQCIYAESSLPYNDILSVPAVSLVLSFNKKASCR